MTSDRSYRDAIGHGRARDELMRHAGTQFDPEVVAAFLAVLDREAARADPADRLLRAGGRVEPPPALPGSSPRPVGVRAPAGG
jgi:HD-GYP domain-containing protein (c-di-GMP phosphodiesterase class II)